MKENEIWYYLKENKHCSTITWAKVKIIKIQGKIALCTMLTKGNNLKWYLNCEKKNLYKNHKTAVRQFKIIKNKSIKNLEVKFKKELNEKKNYYNKIETKIINIQQTKDS